MLIFSRWDVLGVFELNLDFWSIVGAATDEAFFFPNTQFHSSIWKRDLLLSRLSNICKEELSRNQGCIPLPLGFRKISWPYLNQDYTHHIITRPPHRFSDLPTSMRRTEQEMKWDGSLSTNVAFVLDNKTKGRRIGKNILSFFNQLPIRILWTMIRLEKYILGFLKPRLLNSVPTDRSSFRTSFKKHPFQDHSIQNLKIAKRTSEDF